MKINKDMLETVIKNSISKRECFEKLKIHSSSTNSYRTLNFYIKLYDIDVSHFIGYCNKNAILRCSILLSDILLGKYPLYSSNRLKQRLIKEGLFEHRCGKCQLTEWNGKPIPLDLDHINGISTDHRIENLTLLCRNCHAQTDTFCGKNKKRIYKIVELTSQNKRGRKRRDDIKERDIALIEKILNSGIDFSKYGWCKQVSELSGIKHQKVSKWLKTRMPELYANSIKRGTIADRMVSNSNNGTMVLK